MKSTTDYIFLLSLLFCISAAIGALMGLIHENNKRAKPKPKSIERFNGWEDRGPVGDKYNPDDGKHWYDIHGACKSRLHIALDKDGNPHKVCPTCLVRINDDDPEEKWLKKQLGEE